MNLTSTKKQSNENDMATVSVKSKLLVHISFVIHAFYLTDTDTDFSESEALSSLQISGQPKSPQANMSQTDGGEYYSFL